VVTLFPKAHRINQVGIVCPIGWIDTVFDKAMKARMGPVGHAGDVPVFDRIVVEIVAVNIEIPLIANRMFPEPALPNAPFAFLLSSIRQPFPRREGSGKRCLDQPPSRGVVRIVRRQGPQAMKMVGEDNDSVDVKRSLPPHGSEGGAQGVNMFREQAAVAFQEGDREKVGTAGYISSEVVGHIRECTSKQKP